MLKITYDEIENNRKLIESILVDRYFLDQTTYSAYVMFPTMKRFYTDHGYHVLNTMLEVLNKFDNFTQIYLILGSVLEHHFTHIKSNHFFEPETGIRYIDFYDSSRDYKMFLQIMPSERYIRIVEE